LYAEVIRRLSISIGV